MGTVLGTDPHTHTGSIVRPLAGSKFLPRRARTPGSRPGRIAAVPFSGVAVGAAVAAAVAVSCSGRLWPH